MHIPTLEAITVQPKSSAKSCVIWLHGLGADGHDFADIVPQLNLPTTLATRFIFPHAPIKPITINGGMHMRAWYDIYGFSADTKQDETGIPLAEKAITALIDSEVAQGIPANKIVIAGFSQGGAMALYTGLRYPQQLAGVMALSTYLPLAYLWDKSETVKNMQTPIFMAHGISDAVLSLNIGETSKDWLVNAGYQVAWHTYNMAHSVCPEEVSDIANWLTEVLS